MSMYPIASTTVGSGGVASVSFTSIPATFTHLQVRAFAQDARASSYANSPILVTFNGDTGANYTWHSLTGNGSVGSSAGATALNFIYIQSARTGSFGASITDVLDYTNTNKNKVLRSMGGVDNNGSGIIELDSGLWLNTSAITSITLTPLSPNFSQYSSFQLYGISTSNVTGA